MFIPLTHDRATVRSLPWVSFTIIGLCLAVFFYLRLESDAIDASARAYGEAFSFYVEHPYLTPDPQLVSPTGVEQVHRALGSEPPADAVPGLEQRRLDELTDAWRTSLETDPLWKLGMVPDDVRPLGAVAHIFTHAGWMHLLGNLLFFYLTAPFVEDRLGHLPFAAFYLAAGVAAGYFHCLHYPDMNVPLIGASGAISATMGAFLVFFRRARIKVLTFIFIIPRTFLLPAWVVFPFWFFTDLAMAAQSSRADPAGLLSGTAYWAHVGGFLIGVGVAFVFQLVAKPDPDDDELTPASLDVLPAAVSRATSARLAGRPEEAWRLLEAEARRCPDSAPVVDAYWQLAIELGRAPAAAGAMQRRIRVALRDGDRETAAWLWGALDRHAPAAARRPDLAVAVGEALLDLGRRAEGEELLRGAAATAGPETPIGLLIKLLRVAGRVDPALRRQVAAALRSHPQTPPEVRAEVAGELVVGS